MTFVCVLTVAALSILLMHHFATRLMHLSACNFNLSLLSTVTMTEISSTQGRNPLFSIFPDNWSYTNFHKASGCDQALQTTSFYHPLHLVEATSVLLVLLQSLRQLPTYKVEVAESVNLLQYQAEMVNKHYLRWKICTTASTEYVFVPSFSHLCAHSTLHFNFNFQDASTSTVDDSLY